MKNSNTPPRILLLTQWFDPEPTFKGVLFAQTLVDRGFEVEVITGFPNYPGGAVYPGYNISPLSVESFNGVRVSRVPLYPSHDKNKIGRVINYISFAASSLFYGLFVAKKADVLYVYHPPLTVGIAAIFIRLFRRIPVVLDIQDLWPDTLRATGMITNGLVLRIVSKVCSLVYSFVDDIVVLSPGFKRELVARGVAPRKLHVIYNWADEKKLSKRDAEIENYRFGLEGFIVLFAGNIGQAQDLKVILEAAKLLQSRQPEVQFVLMGGGLQVEELKLAAQSFALSNVHFRPAVSSSVVSGFLRSADALLIHLKADPLFEITIPGKTQAYMAVGKPILMGVKGDAASLVKEARCGKCFQPSNAESLAAAVEELTAMPKEELWRLGSNARSFYEERLSLVRGVEQFSKVFSKNIKS